MGAMKTLSLDLRERILMAYDSEQGSREEIGRRFRVSTGMVKKLLQQRRHKGDIGPRHHRSGRKPMLREEHRRRLEEMVNQKPDITLAEMRDALKVGCSLQAIHYVLIDMGLTYKKRLSMRVSRLALMSPGPGRNGLGAKPASIPPGSFSSTNPRPKRT
jgi:transposase